MRVVTKNDDVEIVPGSYFEGACFHQEYDFDGCVTSGEKGLPDLSATSFIQSQFNEHVIFCQVVVRG